MGVCTAKPCWAVGEQRGQPVGCDGNQELRETLLRTGCVLVAAPATPRKPPNPLAAAMAGRAQRRRSAVWIVYPSRVCQMDDL
jgi:hypothetical protein